MTTEVRQRLFGWEQAFEHPFSLWATLALIAAAVSATLIVLALNAVGRLPQKTYRELLARCLTWVVLVPLLLGPILAGASWTMLAVALLGVLCYLEFARNTPLRDEWAINAVVLTGIAAVTWGALDHWWEFFSGAFPLTVVVLAAVSIPRDQPHGYLQRMALGTLGFGMFGMGLGHLGYLANDDDYRPILILLLLAVEANDIFAYLSGKTLGRRSFSLKPVRTKRSAARPARPCSPRCWSLCWAVRLCGHAHRSSRSLVGVGPAHQRSWAAW